MAPTPNIGLTQPTVGSTNWGNDVNTNWDTLDTNLPKSNFNASVAPTGGDNDSLGYGVGSRWFDTTANIAYVCAKASGTAEWIEVGGGAVDSVNGQTGVVVLDADDIDDSSTANKFTNATNLIKLAGIESGADVTDATNVAAAGAYMVGGTDVAVVDGGTGASTAAGARTNLGLGDMATQNANAVNITGGSIGGITDLAVVDGGTGASTAAEARANLGLENGATLKHKLDATAAPTVNDDSGDGYSAGSLWFDITNDTVFGCSDSSTGAAIWELLSHPYKFMIAVFREEQTSGTAGGTFTNGAYRTRVLNTSVKNTIPNCSLASNVITLNKGRYYIEARAPGNECGSHKAKLRKTSATAGDAVIGSTAKTGGGSSNVQTDSIVKGFFTVTENSSTYELQHRSSQTKSTDGFGFPASFGEVEVYAEVMIMKVDSGE